MSEDPNSVEPSTQVLLEYTQSLGMLTIYWAALENSLTVAIERLLRTDQITTECITTSVDKAAARATIIQRLVLRPGESPSDDWRDCVLGLCDQITNNIGPKRNRLVHDEWFPTEEAVLRTNKALRIGKPSEREAKTLLRNSAAPSHKDEIDDTIRLTIAVMLHMMFMTMQYDAWKRTKKLPTVPEQAVLASKGIVPEFRRQGAEA